MKLPCSHSKILFLCFSTLCRKHRNLLWEENWGHRQKADARCELCFPTTWAASLGQEMATLREGSGVVTMYTCKKKTKTSKIRGICKILEVVAQTGRRDTGNSGSVGGRGGCRQWAEYPTFAQGGAVGRQRQQWPGRSSAVQLWWQDRQIPSARGEGWARHALPEPYSICQHYLSLHSHYCSASDFK